MWVKEKSISKNKRMKKHKGKSCRGDVNEYCRDICEVDGFIFDIQQCTAVKTLHLLHKLEVQQVKMFFFIPQEKKAVCHKA